ncbi:Gfo/Idh/MocA family protein [Microbacterium xanthum]|uniref:Gfo/Idh/MocA family protein n=1 Tax=Microbacterium xanthum TaxID=3079794 RepID=UPI002AD2957D|nr:MULTISPECIES: Gfo/Idh/MocA family oxidoreductase [unclassified Microbacterium]MDZ8171155.1 Gfo/Idh/MocA family oxidoreductase [Microbacterium sp. KSW-48]MDZ8201672.1 Gfo/Idh/MocA family oxidoreductase [Microbacterium sp. SSW1-59]
MSRHRVAVIGCGDVSAVHLAAIDQNDAVELVGVCDPDDGRRTAAEQATGVPGYPDVRSLLDDVAPDAVHICTPHDQHAGPAIEALDRGIHVLLEKPLAESLFAADEIIRAADRSSATLGVCFQNRYNPPVQRLRELLSCDSIGEVRSVNATVMWSRTDDYYASRPWRGRWECGGGGLLMNQAIHTVDLLLWLFGPARSVQGGIGNRAHPLVDVEDTADMVITHDSDVRSVLFATVANGANDPVALVIQAESACLRLAGGLHVEWADGRTETVDADVSSGARSYWGVSHRALIDDFYRSLNARESFWIDGRTARTSIAVIKDVYRQAGRPAVGVVEHPARGMEERKEADA